MRNCTHTQMGAVYCTECGATVPTSDAEIARLRAEVERLTQAKKVLEHLVITANKQTIEVEIKADAVVRAAEVIFKPTNTKQGTVVGGRIIKAECPHGISPNYPTHAWWCDECWGALEAALAAYRGRA